MSQNSPQGLLAIWAGLDADDVEAYRQWHNCEHMPERVTLPGFTSDIVIGPSQMNAFSLWFMKPIALR
jgi:hypothetical protein